MMIIFSNITHQWQVARNFFLLLLQSFSERMNIDKRQTFKAMTIITRRLFVSLPLLLCICSTTWGQEGLTIMTHTGSALQVDFRLGAIEAVPTGNGYSTLLTPAANSHSREAGLPMLPQCRRLIAIDGNGDLRVNIEEQEWDTLFLSDIGCVLPVEPYGGARAKDTELTTTAADSLCYATDTLQGPQLLAITPLGLMRGTPIASLTITPVRYNPAKGFIAACRRMKATITTAGDTKRTAGNPMLKAMPVVMPDGGKEYVNTIVQDTMPLGYLVVSASRYRETLQPLLSWKRQEGYIVDELYFDQASNVEVKDSLQRRYDNATADRPSPLFILIVGDMSDIALWTPRHIIPGLETHRTDFYYSEFTGDMLPDAMVGRISVHDTAELRHVVEKTLAYERGAIADTTALRRSLLVAGVEETAPAPALTNGQVDFIKQLLMDHDTTHDTACFYNPASGDSREEILDVLRDGVALVNYTAHCNSRGWRNPMFYSNEINSSNVVDSHLFIAVNNCCRSNDVAAECFGEMLLRKPGGGAVAAIGATNETLWEEDYYWSTGFAATTPEAKSEGGHAGAFERILHPYQQQPSEQAWTAGQMLLAGNSAVEASGSPYAAFYWEIYLLLGDPSLMPLIGPLHSMSLDCDSIRRGDISVPLHGTPWARVAATCGDTLMGLCTLDAAGEATMRLRKPVTSTIRITATRQFHTAGQLTFDIPTDSSGTEGITATDSTGISVFPNPARNRITVSGIKGPATLTIFDSMGRHMMEKELNGSETISLKPHLRKGIYTLMIKTVERPFAKVLLIKE